MTTRTEERTAGRDGQAGTHLYVYGIVKTGSIGGLQADGVADAPVETVDGDGLSAVVGRLPPQNLRIRRRDLDRHLQVLQAVFEETTIVPCAFGTVLAGPDAVREELLGNRAPEVRELLERLDRRLQVNVRAVYDEEVVLREVLVSEPEVRRLSATTREGKGGYLERVRLGEVVAGAVAARRERDAGELLERLSRLAEDVVVEDAGGDDVLRASFLLPNDRYRAFDAELDELARAEAPRLRFTLIGPLPPTAFASLERSR